MADEKNYSPREVALAVLAKAQELLVKAEFDAAPTKVAECQSGMHTVGYYSSAPFEKSERMDCGFEPFQEMKKAETGHEEGVHTSIRPKSKSPALQGISHAGANMGADIKGEHKRVLGEMGKMPKPNLPKSEDIGKAENPDEKQDANLGEAVEGLCERHMSENKSAERKEGHKLVKSEMCKSCKAGNMKKSEYSDLYAELEEMSKAEKAGENEIGTKFPARIDKSEGQGAGNKPAPSNDMKPKIAEKPIERDNQDFETKPGHAPENDHREAPQTPPAKNPHEQHEGNNPPAGAAPGSMSATGAISGKGVHKLSHFVGHQSGKKGMKKGIALG